MCWPIAAPFCFIYFFVWKRLLELSVPKVDVQPKVYPISYSCRWKKKQNIWTDLLDLISFLSTVSWPCPVVYWSVSGITTPQLFKVLIKRKEKRQGWVLSGAQIPLDYLNDGWERLLLLWRLHYFRPVSTALYCNALQCIVLHRTAFYCTAIYCTVLHCTALYCTALCTLLHCIVLHSTALSSTK